MEKQKHKRSSFSGKLGFVLAAAGASVGLGNIWRFPYLAAKYGGGIFLLILQIGCDVGQDAHHDEFTHAKHETRCDENHHRQIEEPFLVDSHFSALRFRSHSPIRFPIFRFV